MSIYETSITNPKKQLEFYKDLSEQLQQENQKLKDNWNKLKEIIRKKQDYYRYFKDNKYRSFLSELLEKINELEQGSDSNE